MSASPPPPHMRDAGAPMSCVTRRTCVAMAVLAAAGAAFGAVTSGRPAAGGRGWAGATAAHTPAPAPAHSSSYARTHHLAEMLGTIWEDTLRSQPADPLQHILALAQTVARPKIAIAGPPAAGKGTQCEQITAALGVVHISTGDLLRDELKHGSDVGKRAQGYMKAGHLVPDELVIDLVRARLNRDDVRAHGWLLDGFPRTVAQARVMREAGIVPDVFVVLDVADAVVTERISGRRVDPVTKKVYHLTLNPPPSQVRARLTQRADDTAEAIGKRLRAYHKEIDPLVALVGNTCPVRRVDGSKLSPRKVFARVLAEIQAVRWAALGGPGRRRERGADGERALQRAADALSGTLQAGKDAGA